MCVNYTDLNRAYPKDAYPLPNIDQLIDGATGHKMSSFLDEPDKWSQNNFHNQIGKLLLQSYAIQTKKSQSYLSTVDG